MTGAAPNSQTWPLTAPPPKGKAKYLDPERGLTPRKPSSPPPPQPTPPPSSPLKPEHARSANSHKRTKRYQPRPREFAPRKQSPMRAAVKEWPAATLKKSPSVDTLALVDCSCTWSWWKMRVRDWCLEGGRL